MRLAVAGGAAGGARLIRRPLEPPPTAPGQINPVGEQAAGSCCFSRRVMYASGGGTGNRGPPPEAPGARHVRITVPAGSKPGSTLTLKSPGGECTIQVPSGLQEGASLQVALPHVEQKIEILNAYFGRNDEGKDYEQAARSVIAHTAQVLGIEDRIKAPIFGREPKLADKVDRCLEYILLDQRKQHESCAVPSEERLHPIDSEKVKLSLCRDRSVDTAVARAIQPLSMQREVEPTPFVGPPTSHHNGIYISGPGYCGFALSCFTAVDDRTLEWRGCAPCLCFPWHEIWTTNDGIRYSTDRDTCGVSDRIERMGSCFWLESCALGYSCKVYSLNPTQVGAATQPI